MNIFSQSPLRKLLISAFLLSFGFSKVHGACIRTWDGGGDGITWNDGGNWDGADEVPGPNDDVVIPASFSGITAANPNNDTIQSLVLAATSDLTLSAGPLTITDNSTIDGALNVTGTGSLRLDTMTLDGSGTLTNQADVTLSKSTIDSGLSLINSGTLIAPVGTANINGTLTTAAGSTIRVVGGTLGFNNATLNVAVGFVNNGTLKRWIRDQIIADFTDGRIVVLDGWILSQFEVRLCALVFLIA